MAEELSQRTVARDIEDGTKFLSTLSKRPPIYRMLRERAGYSSEEHQRGWQLLFDLLGYSESGPDDAAGSASAAAKAIADLDAWDGPNFSRARAALKRKFPEQGEYIFNGLTAAQGAAAVGTVKTFLDRVVALRDGSDAARSGTRDADREATKLLAERRILDEESEARLRKLLDLATASTPPSPEKEQDGGNDPDAEAQHIENAIAFHDWLVDWRAQAREVISKQQYLYWLGLSGGSGGSGGGGGSGSDDGERDGGEPATPG